MAATFSAIFQNVSKDTLKHLGVSVAQYANLSLQFIQKQVTAANKKLTEQFNEMMDYLLPMRPDFQNLQLVTVDPINVYDEQYWQSDFESSIAKLFNLDYDPELSRR